MLQKYRYRSFKEHEPGLPMLHLCRTKQPPIMSSLAAFVKLELVNCVTQASWWVTCKAAQRQNKPNAHVRQLQSTKLKQPWATFPQYFSRASFCAALQCQRATGLKRPHRTFRSFKTGRDRGVVLYWFYPNSKIHQATVPFTPPNTLIWWGEIIQILHFFHISTTKCGTSLSSQEYSAAHIHAIIYIPSDAVRRSFSYLQYMQGKPSNSRVCRQHFMYNC